MYRVGRSLLRERLAERKMSQVELADKAGKSESKVSAHINGVSGMSKETMYLYSKIIGCPMEDLYEWEYIGNNQE